MSEKIYLNLLFLCVILCQGIYATFSDEDKRVSSDFLVRKRRVINHLRSGREPKQIEEVNYIVKIREGRIASCAGAILSHYTVITAASCVLRPLTSYEILSGSAYAVRSNFHKLTSSIAYYGSSPQHQPIDGVALITVDPPFVFTRKTGIIQLFVGPLPAGTLATVFGWGCRYPPKPGPEPRQSLRSITLPIMNHEECHNIYRNYSSNPTNLHNVYTITETHICTYCAQQYCALGDTGAPLVVNNLLVGIHVWKGQYPNHRNPDVFINLQRGNYKNWIVENSLLM